MPLIAHRSRGRVFIVAVDLLGRYRRRHAHAIEPTRSIKGLTAHNMGRERLARQSGEDPLTAKSSMALFPTSKGLPT